MSKKILLKDALQSLSSSFGRFIGIMLLMMVSAFAFIGLKMSGPDMKQAARLFYEETNLADINIFSNYGLDQKDIQIIKKNTPNAQIEFGYLQDSEIVGNKGTLRISDLPTKVSKTQLVKGHLPDNSNQIAISYLLGKKYHLGQKITLKDHQTLKRSHFTVVGFVKASDYTDKSNIGQTNVGSGQLDGIAYVKKSAFKNQDYQLARIRFDRSQKIDPYSKAYESFINDKKKSLTLAFKPRVEQKNADLQKQISQAQEKINLAQANGITLKDAQIKLDKNKEQLKQLGPLRYFVKDRSNDTGYETFHSNAQKIELITNIFPVFLFAVAALVSLTAMARFIDEQRINIGVLRALGYTKVDTCIKFVFYSLSASLIGVLIGSVGGFLWLPKIIFNSYTSNLTLTNFKATFSWYYLILTILIAILSTTGAALIQLGIILRQKPSELLLPKPPKNGSHIWLEKIKPFWNHLSFNYKVTIRNIFRYKIKMLMTILGVAGCTGLLVMGFGIRDSLMGIGDKQYRDITKYDIIAVEKEGLTQTAEHNLQKVMNSKDIESHTSIYLEQLTKKIDKTTQNISLVVPKNETALQQYFGLQGRKNKEKIRLKDNKVVISEKLAKLLGAQVGDKIKLKRNNGKTITLKIGQICEMYMGHYILINSITYQKYFLHKPQFNSQLIITNAHSHKKVEKIAHDLIDSDAIQTVNLNINNKKIIDSLIQSMNKVMFLLIALASVLAIVVIFTLTTANLEERMREISTVKVLGFYNNETTMYIYRETIILSIIGILVGFIIGNWLHSFIIENLAPLNMMFDPKMLWTNYLISALIPIIITLILSFFVYRKIKDIDMLKALQAVD